MNVQNRLAILQVAIHELERMVAAGVLRRVAVPRVMRDTMRRYPLSEEERVRLNRCLWIAASSTEMAS